MGKPVEIFDFEWAVRMSENDLMVFGAIPVGIVVIALAFIAVSSVFGRRNWEKIADTNQ